jgi:hypothetical protein
MTKRTYLKQNQSPTGYRPRMFHPTLDVVVPSLKNRSPPSQGYRSTRMGSRVTLNFPNQSTLKLSQISQHTTIQSTPSLFSLDLHHPKTMNHLHYHAVPQALHLFLRLQCIWSRISMLRISIFSIVSNV